MKKRRMNKIGKHEYKYIRSVVSERNPTMKKYHEQIQKLTLNNAEAKLEAFTVKELKFIKSAVEIIKLQGIKAFDSVFNTVIRKINHKLQKK